MVSVFVCSVDRAGAQTASPQDILTNLPARSPQTQQVGQEPPTSDCFQKSCVGRSLWARHVLKCFLHNGLNVWLTAPLGNTHCMEKKTEARAPVISPNTHTFVPSEDWRLFFLSWGAPQWGQEEACMTGALSSLRPTVPLNIQRSR